MKAEPKRSWIVIFQPRDAEQFKAATMKVIDCWLDDRDYKAAYAEMNERVQGYIAEHGDGKISLFEGDRQANYLWPYIKDGVTNAG